MTMEGLEAKGADVAVHGMTPRGDEGRGEQEPSAPDSGGPQQLRHPGRRWWLLVVVALAQLMVVMNATIANMALPQAQAELGMSDGQRQWIISGYALAFGALLLLGGRLGDILGRKRVFVGGLIAFAVASAVAGLAPSFGVLVAGRVAQGASGALLAPAALSLLTTTFTVPAERARAFGVYGAVSAAGAGVGLLTGGALTQTLSWRWCFALQVPLALAALAGALVLLRHVRAGTTGSIDVGGALLAVAGLSSLVMSMSLTGTEGWGSPVTLGLLAAAIVLLTVFVLVELRRRAPLLPLEIVKDRDRAASFLAVVMLTVASAGVFYFLTFYFQEIRGVAPVMSGVAFLPMVLMSVVTSMLTSTVLLPRMGPRLLVAGGMLVTSVGLFWLSALTPSSSYLTVIMPGLFLVGLGFGCILTPGMARATLGVRPEHAGAASGLVNTSQQIGLALGTALLSSIALSITAGSQSQADVVSGYGAAFATGACVMLLGAILTGVLYRSAKASSAGAR